MTDREALAADLMKVIVALDDVCWRRNSGDGTVPNETIDRLTDALDKVKIRKLFDALAALAPSETGRACTCHPDDNPPKPCPERFAYSECVAAAAHPSPVPAETEPFCVSLYREAALREPAPVPAEYVRVARSTLEYWRDMIEDIMTAVMRCKSLDENGHIAEKSKIVEAIRAVVDQHQGGNSA